LISILPSNVADQIDAFLSIATVSFRRTSNERPSGKAYMAQLGLDVILTWVQRLSSQFYNPFAAEGGALIVMYCRMTLGGFP